MLKIPLDMPPSIDLLKLIADQLLHSEYLPYILRKGCYFKYPLGYECVIKHDMDMRRIFQKLDAGEYTKMSQFRSDLLLMWSSVRMFFGSKSYETARVNKLDQDLSLLQQLKMDVNLAN